MIVKKNIVYFANILIFLCFASYIGSFIISAFFASQEINIVLKVILVALIVVIIAACYLFGSVAQEWDFVQDLYDSENHIHIWEIVIVACMVIFSICISFVFYGVQFHTEEILSIIFSILMIPAVYVLGRAAQDIITGLLASLFCMVLPIGAISGNEGFVFDSGVGFLNSCKVGIDSINNGGIFVNILTRLENITHFSSSLPKLVLCIFFFFSIWSGLFLFVSKKNGGVFLAAGFNLMIILQILFDFSSYFYLLIYPIAALTAAMGISFFVHKWIFNEDLEEGYDDATESSFENFSIVDEEKEEKEDARKRRQEKIKEMEKQEELEKKKEQEQSKALEITEIDQQLPEQDQKVNEISDKLQEEDISKQKEEIIMLGMERSYPQKADMTSENNNMTISDEAKQLNQEQKMLFEPDWTEENEENGEEELLYHSEQQDEEEEAFFEELAISAKETEHLREQVQQAEEELTELTEKYQRQKMQLKDLIQLLEQAKERQKKYGEKMEVNKQKILKLESQVKSLHDDVKEKDALVEEYREQNLQTEKIKDRLEEVQEQNSALQKEMEEQQKETEKYRLTSEEHRIEAEKYRQAAEENQLKAEQLKEEIKSARLEAEMAKAENDRYKEEAENFRRQSEEYHQENAVLLNKIDDLREQLNLAEQNSAKEELELLKEEKEHLEIQYHNRFEELQKEKSELEKRYQEEIQKRKELLRRAKEEINRVRNQTTKRNLH